MAADPRGALAVAAITGLAIILRSIAIGYGLPAIYNPDEVAIMNRALGLAEHGLNPRNFVYPTLYFYVLFAWEGLWFVAGWLLGIYESLGAFERAYFVDPSALYLAGRWLTVLAGAATVVATCQLGRVLFGPAAGLAAGLLLAVAPLAVRDGHYVKHDVPVTLLVVLLHLVLASDLTGARRRAVLAGVLAGLAASVHYYAVFVVVPVAVAMLTPIDEADTWRVRLGRLVVAGTATVVAFFAASPFLLVQPLDALRDMVANRQIVVDRATAESGAFTSLAFYGRWLAGEAMGRGAFGAAVAGLVVVAATGWRRLALVTLFPVVFLLFIANTVPASRYLNAVLPFVALLGGATVGWLATRGRGGRVLAGLLVTGIALEAAVASVAVDRFFRQTDTRTLALAWIEAHVPVDASVLVQPYSVPLRQSREGLVEALEAHLGSADRASVRFRRQLALDPYPAPAWRTIYLGDGGEDTDKIYVSPGAFGPATSLDPLRARGVTWVVLKQDQADPAMAALEAALEREGRLAARFDPYAAGLPPETRRQVAPFLHNTDARIRPELERPGPIIDIWTLDR